MLLDLDWQEFQMNKDVKMMVKPLDFPSYQRIMSIFKVGVGENIDNESKNKLAESFNPMTNPEMADVIKEILPKHVKDVTGLQIKLDGEIKDATIGDIVSISQCVLISVSIMMQVFSISNIVGDAREEGKK